MDSGIVFMEFKKGAHLQLEKVDQVGLLKLLTRFIKRDSNLHSNWVDKRNVIYDKMR